MCKLSHQTILCCAVLDTTRAMNSVLGDTMRLIGDIRANAAATAEHIDVEITATRRKTVELSRIKEKVRCYQ
jgi:hypothetical protein